jgi:hypothetical protein
LKLRRGDAAARISQSMAASDERRGPRAKREGEGAGDKNWIGRRGWRCRQAGQRASHTVAGGRSLMVQDLANFAAVLVIDGLIGCGTVVNDRVLRLAANHQIVVVPAKEDRLEQEGEDAKPRR